MWATQRRATKHEQVGSTPICAFLGVRRHVLDFNPVAHFSAGHSKDFRRQRRHLHPSARSTQALSWMKVTGRLFALVGYADVIGKLPRIAVWSHFGGQGP